MKKKFIMACAASALLMCGVLADDQQDATTLPNTSVNTNTTDSVPDGYENDQDIVNEGQSSTAIDSSEITDDTAANEAEQEDQVPNAQTPISSNTQDTDDDTQTTTQGATSTNGASAGNQTNNQN